MTKITLYSESIGTYIDNLTEKIACEIDTRFSNGRILFYENALETQADILAEKFGAATFEIKPDSSTPVKVDTMLRHPADSYWDGRVVSQFHHRGNVLVAWVIYKYKCRGDANLLKFQPNTGFQPIDLECEVRVDDGEFWLYIPTSDASTPLNEDTMGQVNQQRNRFVSSIEHNLRQLSSNIDSQCAQIRTEVVNRLSGLLAEAKVEQEQKHRPLQS